jgi:hypothetical protein
VDGTVGDARLANILVVPVVIGGGGQLRVSREDTLGLANSPPLEEESMGNVRRILDDIELLVPLITYLGSNPFWWARSAPSIAKELGLDEARVGGIFERYPMIFRKSRYIEESKAHSYALQMRYAQRHDGQTEQPPEVSAFPVLSEAQVLALVEFLVKLSTLESSVRTAARNAYIAVAASLVSAGAAVAVALLK